MGAYASGAAAILFITLSCTLGRAIVTVGVRQRFLQKTRSCAWPLVSHSIRRGL